MNSLVHGFDGRPAGRITLDVACRDGLVVLDYRDDGRGMPPEHAQRMFDPFFTTRRGQGGSGLGLHVVYNVVTQTLGGRIEGHSAPGQGVHYRIEVPREPAAPPVEAGAAAHPGATARAEASEGVPHGHLA